MLARQQFVLNPYKFPELKVEQASVEKEEAESYVKLEAFGQAILLRQKYVTAPRAILTHWVVGE